MDSLCRLEVRLVSESTLRTHHGPWDQSQTMQHPGYKMGPLPGLKGISHQPSILPGYLWTQQTLTSQATLIH